MKAETFGYAHEARQRLPLLLFVRIKTVTPSQSPSLLGCDVFETVTSFSNVTLREASQCSSLLVCDVVTV